MAVSIEYHIRALQDTTRKSEADRKAEIRQTETERAKVEFSEMTLEGEWTPSDPDVNEGYEQFPNDFYFREQNNFPEWLVRYLRRYQVP